MPAGHLVLVDVHQRLDHRGGRLAVALPVESQRHEVAAGGEMEFQGRLAGRLLAVLHVERQAARGSPGPTPASAG